jgi:hypothetical protein
MHDTDALKQELESINEEIEFEFQILESILISSLKYIYEDDPGEITVEHVNEMKRMFLSLITHVELLRNAHDDLDIFASFQIRNQTVCGESLPAPIDRGQLHL